MAKPNLDSTMIGLNASFVLQAPSGLEFEQISQTEVVVHYRGHEGPLFHSEYCAEVKKFLGPAEADRFLDGVAEYATRRMVMQKIVNNS